MLTATSYAAYIKRQFPKGFIDNSFTALIDTMWKELPKETDAAGDLLVYLFDADDSFTASGDLATVQATNAATTENIGSQFQFPWVPVSDEAQLTAEVITKSQNNDSAWQSATKTAMKKKIAGLNHLLALQLVGQGWGEIGQITGVSGATFQLSIPSRINRIVNRMPLIFAADLNTSAARSATPIYVTAVDPDNNLVTCSANLSVPGGANNDFVFVGGLRPSGAPGGVRGNAFPGFDAWFPDRRAAITDATVSTLGGINRANNPRLYGTYVNAIGGGSPLSALISATQKAATNFGATDLTYYCSQANFATVALDLANPVNYEGNPGKKTVGTTDVVFYSNGTTTGRLKVTKMMDDNVIFGIEKGAVAFRSFGSMPKVDNLDGLELARLATSQGYSTRFYGLGGLKVVNPSACVRIQLA
jgi:hypothetical protein